jgi:NitT/TauT family transport system permease protein
VADSALAAPTLDLGGRGPAGALLAKGWSKVWPPLLALVLVLLIWQVLVLLEVKPSYVLPGPLAVGEAFLEEFSDPKFWSAISTTMLRAITGFLIAGVIGSVVGIAVARSTVLRAAIGSLITGLQTMPSIAWFPFAILLFGFTEQAILFVVVLGAAPSIANGVISGVDDVPPALLKTAHVLGAKGLTLYTRVIIPAALTSYLSGLKQGWAFAWRGLMAGELLVIIASRPSLGVQLNFFREFANAPGLIALMIVILIIGILVDGVFSRIMNAVRIRRGLGMARL